MADLEQRVAPRPHVADAHLVLGDADRAQVLAEGGGAQVRVELLGPPEQVLGGVGVHGLVGTPVHRQVGLRVAGEVEW